MNILKWPYSGALAGEGARSGAPWVRKCGKLPIRENLVITREEKLGGRPAKLNEIKGDRDLEREMKNKGEILSWKNNMTIL